MIIFVRETAAYILCGKHDKRQCCAMSKVAGLLVSAGNTKCTELGRDAVPLVPSHCLLCLHLSLSWSIAKAAYLFLFLPLGSFQLFFFKDYLFIHLFERAQAGGVAQGAGKQAPR